MALRKIVTINNEELLRRKSKEVVLFDEKLHQLLEDMKETMLSQNGAGLAAPQLGILKRVIICLIDEKKIMEFINPVIEKASGEIDDTEGCLSIPGKSGNVKRPAEICLTAQNRNGKRFKYCGSDFNARVVCHEVDHLDGILYIDKAEKITP